MSHPEDWRTAFPAFAEAIERCRVSSRCTKVKTYIPGSFVQADQDRAMMTPARFRLRACVKGDGDYDGYMYYESGADRYRVEMDKRISDALFTYTETVENPAGL